MQSKPDNSEKIAQDYGNSLLVYSSVLYEDEELTQPVQLSYFGENLRFEASRFIRITKIDFGLKFKLLRKQAPVKFDGSVVQKGLGEPYGITFIMESQKTPQTLYSGSSSELYKWRDHLSLVLVQTDFHILYKAIRKIGKGNCATVYLGERLEDGKRVAVKAFSKDMLGAQARGLQALHNQIQILRKLKHKNLLQLFEVFQTQNSVYLCAEYLAGSQLFHRALKQRFSLQQTQNIIRQILEGLKHLSELGILHRDLKPENIIFREVGSDDLVIADFGLATHSNSQDYIYVRCGTPGFVAPEILKSKRPNGQGSVGQSPISDMFSLGVIIYFLEFHRVPFRGSSLQQVSSNNRKCLFDFHPRLEQRMHPDLLDLLLKMLESNPQKRITAQQALAHKFLQTNFNERVIQETNVTTPTSLAHPACDAYLQVRSQQKPDLTKIADSLGSFVLGKTYLNKSPEDDPLTSSGAFSPFRAAITPPTAQSSTPQDPTQTPFAQMAAEKSEYFKEAQPRKKVHLDPSLKSSKVTNSDLFSQ